MKVTSEYGITPRLPLEITSKRVSENLNFKFLCRSLDLKRF